MDTQIEVPTVKGMIKVPCYFHENVKDLCVTMCEFGVFEVTHVETGRKIIGGFERACNAAVMMLRFQIAANEVGIDFSGGMEFIKNQISEAKDFKHESLSGMSIIEAVNLHKQVFPLTGEFPWENDEDSPFVEIEKLEKML